MADIGAQSGLAESGRIPAGQYLGRLETVGLNAEAAEKQTNQSVATLSAGSGLMGKRRSSFSLAWRYLRSPIWTGKTSAHRRACLNRRDIRKANEGVALALSMESPIQMLGTNYGVSGGFG